MVAVEAPEGMLELPVVRLHPGNHFKSWRDDVRRPESLLPSEPSDDPAGRTDRCEGDDGDSVEERRDESCPVQTRGGRAKAGRELLGGVSGPTVEMSDVFDTLDTSCGVGAREEK